MKSSSLAIVLFLMILSGKSFAQSDYRSAQTGDWNNVTTWQVFDGITWGAAIAVPTSASGNIEIRTGHVVTVPAGYAVTVDQLTVTEDLIIASGGQLTLADGSGTDMNAVTASSLVQVLGTFIRGNGSVIDNQSVAARLQFGAGSIYRHGYTTSFGDLPTSTWNATSTIEITGFTNTLANTLTANNTWAQAVGNVVYNAPGQRGLIDFAGFLTTIAGDFSILNSGTNALQLSTNQNPTVSVAGNFSVGGTSRFTLATDGTAATLTVGGNFIFTSTNTSGSNFTLTGTSAINITGDFSMDAGTTGRIHMTGAGTTGQSTINLQGNFTITSGRIDELGAEPAAGTINIIGVGNRTFTNQGTITGHINYIISAATILDVGTSPIAGASPSAFTLNGGTLIVRSLDPLGAITTSPAQGNIRTSATYRTYAPGSTIIYAGAGPQFMGAGQPSVAGITTIVNNPSGLKLAANVTVNGVLNLQSGDLDLDNFRLTSGGTFTATGGLLRGTPLSTLLINGTSGGNWGTIAFNPSAATVGILTLDRTGTNAGVVLNSTLVVDSLFNLTRGNFTNTSGLTMADDADIIRYSTSTLLGTSPAAASGSFHVTYRTFSPAAGPFADFSTGLELPSDNTSLGNLTIGTARTGDFVNLNHNVAINGSVNLGRGTLRVDGYTITMRGAVWSDNSGNILPATSTIIFDGATAVNGTSNATFNNVQLTSAHSVDFQRSFTATGNITLAAGSTFSMGAQTATLTGTSTQTISANGASFYNITINKTGGSVQLTSALNLVNLLQFGSSTNMNLASNGFLTLLSTSDAAGTGTASIYRLLNGNTVSGNVTVQRYMSGEGRIYRYLSSPVTNATISQWKDDFVVMGVFQDPSPTQIICGKSAISSTPSLFYYDETVAGGSDQGYVAYPRPGTSSTNSLIVPGRGYSTFIRVCINPTVVDVTGPINQGIMNLPVTYTATPDVNANGWNLVGNPYPATIDWDIAGWTKTRMSSIISITDNGSGMVRYYDAGVTEDIPNGQIAPGQGFFVRATAANPILTIRENTKVTNNAEFFRQATPYIESAALTFAHDGQYDVAYLKLLDSAAAALDKFDAPKIYNPTFSFATVSEDGVPMAINALSALSCGSSMKIEMTGVESGSYKASVNTKGLGQFQFVLVDNYLKTKTVLSQAGHMFEVTEAEGSKAKDRFRLLLEERTPVTLEVSAPDEVTDAETEAEIVLSTSEKNFEYSVVNTEGVVVVPAQKGTGSALIFSLPVVSLQEGDNNLTISVAGSCINSSAQSVLVRKTAGINERYVMVKSYPNPVNNQLNIEVIDEDVETIQLVSSMGQVFETIRVGAEDSKVYSIDFTNFRGGLYIMTVTSRNNKKQSYRLIKK